MPGQRGGERLALEIEAQHDRTVRLFRQHRGGEIVGEHDRSPGCSRRAPLAKACQFPPPRSCARVISTVAAPRVPTSRAGITLVSFETKQVARPQQIGQVGDAPVREPAIRRHDQQARRVTRLGRAVGDQLARQVEIEILKAHGAQSIAELPMRPETANNRHVQIAGDVPMAAAPAARMAGPKGS